MMKIFHFLLFAIVVMGCNRENKEKEYEKTDFPIVKHDVASDIDSARTFFLETIKDLESNPSNVKEIKSSFMEYSLVFERNIQTSLDEINRLGENGDITNEQGQVYLEELQKSQPLFEYRKALHMIDSIESIQDSES